MKIRQVLLFLLYIFALLILVAIVFPKDGIQITNSFKLKFLTIDEIFSTPKEYANLKQILLKNINLDSLLNSKSKNISDSLILDEENLKGTIQELEFGTEGGAVLDSFFKKLSLLRSDGNLIRVMHYGDSQIECDRISSFLRYKLQNQFGGCGIGFMSVVQPFEYQFAISVVPSSNWVRYTLNGIVDKTINHRNYGFLGSFCRFAPVSNDSIFKDSILYTASIDVSTEKFGYSNAKKFKQFRLFYGNNKRPVYIELKNGDKVYKDTLVVSKSTSVKSWVFDDYTDNLKINLSGFDSPDVYSLAFDDTKGIAVDNIALRGNSGTIFTALDYNNLSNSLSLINSQLFILQFGGNVLPRINSDKDCENYAKLFLSQINRLKSINPDAGIIVVGPADKSIKEKDKYVSYKYIEPLIKELKKATFKGGAAYWDIYKAMGGKNSMPSWVDAELAGTDYIHFSPDGASIIANMLYNAIYFQYNVYLKNENNKGKELGEKRKMKKFENDII